MRSLKIGLGRMYNVQGVSLTDLQDISMKFNLDEIEVNAFIGSQPLHKVFALHFDPPVKKNQDLHPNVTHSKGTDFPSANVYPADVYFEIVATQFINVEDEIAKSLNEKNDAAIKMIEIVLNEKKANLTNAINYISGLIGLKLHCLLVSKRITEQTYIYYEKGYRIGTSLKYTVTDAVVLDQHSSGIADLESKIPKNINPEKFNKDSEILAWLLKAWEADDAILKFSCLFTALETSIPGTVHDKQADWEFNRKSILDLLKQFPASEVSADQIKFVENLRIPSPSIIDRFSDWAKTELLPGWEFDIVAFKKFCRIRNLFLHSGDADIQFEIKLEAGDLRSLEDITERYVCLKIFRDANVYKTGKKGRFNNMLVA